MLVDCDSRPFATLLGSAGGLAATECQPDLVISKADVSAWIHSDNLQVLATTDVLIDQADRAISPSWSHGGSGWPTNTPPVMPPFASARRAVRVVLELRE